MSLCLYVSMSHLLCLFLMSYVLYLDLTSWRHSTTAKQGEDGRASHCHHESESGELSAQAASQSLQGVRRERHLSARAAAQYMQGVRRKRHLSARAVAQHMQGVRRERLLRKWAAAQSLQGLCTCLHWPQSHRRWQSGFFLNERVQILCTQHRWHTHNIHHAGTRESIN